MTGTVWLLVDCEGVAAGGTTLTQLGAVPVYSGPWRVGEEWYYLDATNHKAQAVPHAGAMDETLFTPGPTAGVAMWGSFADWLATLAKGSAVKFVSDNPAYDWQPVNYGLLTYVGRNPFGHSARRIGDYYAGLVGNWYETQAWKRLRVTKHTHHPVDDARGNAEALVRLLNGERP